MARLCINLLAVIFLILYIIEAPTIKYYLEIDNPEGQIISDLEESMGDGVSVVPFILNGLDTLMVKIKLTQLNEILSQTQKPLINTITLIIYWILYVKNIILYNVWWWLCDCVAEELDV